MSSHQVRVLIYVTHFICSAQGTFTHSASDCYLLVCASGFGAFEC